VNISRIASTTCCGWPSICVVLATNMMIANSKMPSARGLEPTRRGRNRM